LILIRLDPRKSVVGFSADSVALGLGGGGMNPVVRMIGKVLRLVGISSPEDSAPKAKSTADPPNWRDAAGKKPK
jgi:hypothetical protein